MSLAWEDLRTLLALGRARSFAGAGKLLKLDHSTVSRRVASLEAKAGQPLVVRTPDGIALTPAGEMLFETAARMEFAALAAERRLAGGIGDAVSAVRVSTTEGMSPFLLDRFVGLLDANPRLRLEVSTSNGPVDLSRGEADIAVRMFRPTEPSLIARKIGTVGWGLFASEDYVARRGTATLENLKEHTLLGYDSSLRSTPGAQWLATHLPDAHFAMLGQSPSAVARAAGAGAGVAVIPAFMHTVDPRLRRLVPGVLAESEVYTVVHQDLRNAPAVRLVLDYLTHMFAENRKLLRGED
jgi:DNA-binding transcriptional LysR family regulator